jgi:hypothetical protein
VQKREHGSLFLLTPSAVGCYALKKGEVLPFFATCISLSERCCQGKDEDMDRFIFWQRWLFAIALIIIIYGLGLAFFGQTEFFNIILNNQINTAFWGTAQISKEVILYQRFVYGVVGTTAAGWGILIAFVTHYAFLRKEKWAWTGLAVGLTIWFLTDTLISIYYGAYSNAGMNILLFICTALPLIFTKREFI